MVKETRPCTGTDTEKNAVLPCAQHASSLHSPLSPGPARRERGPFAGPPSAPFASRPLAGAEERLGVDRLAPELGVVGRERPHHEVLLVDPRRSVDATIVGAPKAEALVEPRVAFQQDQRLPASIGHANRLVHQGAADSA